LSSFFTGQFEDHYNSDQHSRQFENWFLRGAELCFGDGRISAAEIAGTGKGVAGALRGLLLVIRLDPALIERLRHAGAGGHQHGFFLALGDGRKKKAQYKKSNKKPVQSR